jgi:hypothetical protein
MSLDAKNVDFTPPLPLPVPDNKVIRGEPAKRVDSTSQQHSTTTTTATATTAKHLISGVEGVGVSSSNAHFNGTPTGPILRRGIMSERILEPHVVHIRKTETGKNNIKKHT